MENISELYPTELNELIYNKVNQPRPVASATLKKYIQTYLHLSDTLNKNDNWVKESSTEQLVKIVNRLDMNATGKLNILNLFVMMRKDTLDINTLIELRTRLNKKKLLHTAELIENKRETLPDYKTVNKYIDDLYNQKKYVDFVINYLIFTYGLRNRDINLEIITNENYKKATEAKNYLVIRKSDLLLIVNDYKTKSSYGVKKIQIRSGRILDCANKLREGALIRNKFNNPVNDENLSYYIRLYDDLNESDYFKINVLHIQTLPNPVKELAKICSTRGSCDINTINTYYNISK